jgi:orotate phosphoribosyltransferase
MSHAFYLDPLFDPDKLALLGSLISDKINEDKKFIDINTIAVTGYSGVAISGLVSVLTNLPLILVRKGNDSHSDNTVEFPSNLYNLNYIIVDDLIASGFTIDSIHYKMKSTGVISTLKKIYLYNDLSKNREYSYVMNGIAIPVYNAGVLK